MKWIDFEKQKPKNNGYYLCQIWGFSVNQYGNFTEYRISYFMDDKFPTYPIKAIVNDELMEYQKVIWWCEIEKPPINREHFKHPIYKKIEMLPVEK